MLTINKSQINKLKEANFQQLGIHCDKTIISRLLFGRALKSPKIVIEVKIILSIPELAFTFDKQLNYHLIF